MTELKENEEAGGIIVNSHGLVLCGNFGAEGTGYDWDKAVQLCQGIDRNGRKDWRLPTIGELYSIFLAKDHLPDGYKVDFYQCYWSCTPMIPVSIADTDLEYAYLIYMLDGKKLFATKNTFLKVCAVRGHYD